MKHVIWAECDCNGGPRAFRIVQKAFEGDARQFIANLATLKEPLLSCKACQQKKEPRTFRYGTRPVPTMCQGCRASIEHYHAFFIRQPAKGIKPFLVAAFPALERYLQTEQFIWFCETCWPIAQQARQDWVDSFMRDKEEWRA